MAETMNLESAIGNIINDEFKVSETAAQDKYNLLRSNLNGKEWSDYVRLRGETCTVADARALLALDHIKAAEDIKDAVAAAKADEDSKSKKEKAKEAAVQAEDANRAAQRRILYGLLLVVTGIGLFLIFNGSN